MKRLVAGLREQQGEGPRLDVATTGNLKVVGLEGRVCEAGDES